MNETYNRVRGHYKLETPNINRHYALGIHGWFLDQGD